MRTLDRQPETTPTTGAPGVWNTARNGYGRLASHQPLACAMVFFLTLGIRAALLPWFPPPMPAIHDEMSYLLAGDTYASGRLANPPHPFWQHFETFHVLQQPTYASKYPPLQGMALGAGQKLAGQPWVGVYVSAGLMCAAICWMLQGWITPNLALLGALLVMLRIGVMSYWMNSYWGGAIPAIGGALVLGALARMCRRQQLGHAATWALGLAILIHSRPYDAAVLGLASSVVLLLWLRKSGTAYLLIATRIALPAAGILLVAVAAVAYNNQRVTGSALTLPFQLYDAQYGVPSMFAFMPLHAEPVYRHAVMREFFHWNADLWRTARADLVTAFLLKVSALNDFFFGLWPLLIPPLIWPYPLKTAEERWTVVLLAIFLLAEAPLIGFQPHYAAAVAGLIYLRFLQSIGRLNAWWLGGKPLGFALAVAFITLLGYGFCHSLSVLFREGVEVSKFALAREGVVQSLARLPGPKLVLVRYAPDHRVHDEWVFNRADIDAAPIVWAREMDPDQDRPFVEYYRGRQVFLLEADQVPPKLTPYIAP